jgi:hypothetical protein
MGNAVPGTIGGAIAGFYSGRLAEQAKRRDRIREDHLSDLKAHLLGIISARISRYYEPVCNRQAGILERAVVQINKPSPSVAENPYLRSEFKLQIIPIRSETADFMTSAPGIQLHAQMFEQLYADARANHYSKLITAIEEFTKPFEAAANLHLRHAEKIKRRLQDVLKLPAQIASLSDNSTSAEYEELALFIYRYHLGINPFHLTVFSHTPLDVSASSTQQKMVHVAAPEQATAALAAVNKVSEEMKADLDFMSDLDPLKPRLQDIKRQLDDAIKDKRLPSRCPYTEKI